MKKILKELYKSRLGQYLISGTIYMVFWKLIGFEFTVIILGATILGELHYSSEKES